jgi:two-component system NtrC family sensor kinase
MLRIRSLKTTIFVFMFLSLLIILLLFSYFTINIVNNKIESITEQEILNEVALVQKIYEGSQNQLLKSGIILSKDSYFNDRLNANDKEALKNLLKNTAETSGIDIAAIVDSNGIVVASNSGSGNSLSINGIVEYAMTSRIPIVSTEIISGNELFMQDEKLVFLTKIRRIPGVYEKGTGDFNYITDGMGIVAVAPVYSNATGSYAVVLVDLLNRDYRLPDMVKDATNLDLSIYQKDVAISTTIMTQKQNRFIGTVVAEAVFNRTIRDGEVFNGRIWTINEWTRSVYVPVRNFKGGVIGAIGFGESYEQFRNASFFFRQSDISQIIVMTTIIAILFSLLISYLFSRRLMKPIDELIDSANKLRDGNFEQGVKASSYKEINELVNTFNIMIRYVRKQIVDNEKEIIRKYDKEYKKRKE